MERIQSFTTWLESNAVDLDRTGEWKPQKGSSTMLRANQSTMRPNQFGISTAQADPNLTADYIPGQSADSKDFDFSVGPSSGSTGPIDPDIAQSATSLQTIHGQLRSIFAKAREKAAAFRYPKMKAAFDRELLAGIDGVGRAHAIILPSAQGADQYD